LTAAEVAATNDAAIIEASCGDPDRFAALYQRYAVEVHRYAYRRIGPQQADDVVAETFLTAFRRRASYDPAAANARPWLYGIATREISRHRRTERARYRALIRIGGEPPVDVLADQVAADVSARAVRAELAGAIALLAPGDRDVLLLYAWAGLKYEEIADALRIPVGTVRSRLNRVRRKVRGALGDIDPTALIEET
jgi:RNA polymerase sigma-70 factor (ECF subfamily)